MGMPTFLTTNEVQKVLRYKSRTAFHVAITRTPGLRACLTRIAGKLLFDEMKLADYLERCGIEDAEQRHKERVKA